MNPQLNAFKICWGEDGGRGFQEKGVKDLGWTTILPANELMAAGGRLTVNQKETLKGKRKRN